MSDDYVRKDVYDANMAEIRALMAASESRHERLTEELRGDIKAWYERADRLEDNIAMTNNRINDLRDENNKGLTRLTVIITVLQVALSILFFFLSR